MKITKKHSFILFVLSLILAFAPNVRAVELVISGNGSESNSQINTQIETITEVTQTNEANISNEVNTNADTGGNSASGNSGGETSINTGDIDTKLTVENSVNSTATNIDCCAQDTGASITGNGSDSQNSINLEQNNNTGVVINQSADIKNDVKGSANTGGNSANDNGGNVSIKTGDIYVSGGVENGPINVANVTAPSGGGDISAVLHGNGAGSTNSIFASFSNNTNIFTNYQANIQNAVYWDLNTGKNTANGNNGDVSILTGDIFFDFFIKNGPINIGGIDIPCCRIFEPEEPEEPEQPEEPEEPEEPGDGDNGGEEPGNGGDGDGDGNGGGDDGDGGVGGGPGVIGLSDTRSKAAQALFFWAGLLMIVYGIRLIGKETSGKNAPRNAK